VKSNDVGRLRRLSLIGRSSGLQRVEPPGLLEFTWVSAATTGQASLVTVELLERGSETEVVLTHSRLPDQPTVAAYQAGWTELMGQFWESRFEYLDAQLDELKARADEPR